MRIQYLLAGLVLAGGGNGVFLTVTDHPQAAGFAAQRRSAGHQPEDWRRQRLAFHQWAVEGIGRRNHQSTQQAEPPQPGILHHAELWQPDSRVRVQRQLPGIGEWRGGVCVPRHGCRHFYAVYLPWGGQQLRAKHFWASIVKADGDGYLRSLKAVYVPGVPSETDRWYKVRLEAKGPSMEVWVDGRLRCVSLMIATRAAW